MAKYDHIDLTPPKSVADEATKGLQIRRALPPSRRCCTKIGIARARDLKNQRRLSPKTIRRMVSFFQRHQHDARVGWDEPGKESKGYQAHLLWGGDAGFEWAKARLAEIEKVESK